MGLFQQNHEEVLSVLVVALMGHCRRLVVVVLHVVVLGGCWL